MLDTVPNGSQIANIVTEQYYGRKGFSRNRKIRLLAGLRRPELFALDFSFLLLFLRNIALRRGNTKVGSFMFEIGMNYLYRYIIIDKYRGWVTDFVK